MGKVLSVEVRKVTVEDYDKVLEIRDSAEIYNGGDSLPFEFHDMIRDPQNEGFVGMVKGKCIVFGLVTLIDDRTTILMRSLRIRNTHSGQGIIRLFTEWIMRHYLAKKVKLMRFTSSQYKIYEKVQKQELRFVTMRKSTIFRSAIKEVKSIEIDPKKLEMTLIDAEQLSYIFQNNCLKESLFPTNCFTIFSIPLQPITSNIPFILRQTKLLIATDIQNEESIILSSGMWCLGQEMSSYYIDIYGNLKLKSKLRTHLIMHTNNCIRNMDGVVEIRISTDESVNLNSIEIVLREFNIRKNRVKILIVADKRLKECRKRNSKILSV